MRLERPSIKYKYSFVSYFEEYDMRTDLGSDVYKNLYREGKEHFENYIVKLDNHSKGIDLDEGWKPYYTYWLIDETDEILGVIRIRADISNEYLTNYIGNIGYDIRPSKRGLGLGNLILKLGLIESEKLDLHSVLVLCNEENKASRKVIENCGGVYKNSVVTPDGETLRKYFILICKS